jgi:type I restriction enzyme S subunit
MMYTRNDSPALPEGWVVTTLGGIIEPSAEKVDPLAIEKSPYVGLEHIQKAAGVLSGSGWSSDVRSTKSAFHCGDLLYGKLRPYLNKVWVADFDGVCSTDILVFPGGQHVSTEFLGFRFLSTDFVDYATQNMTGVQHPRVHFDALRHFPIALPPSAEQRRIVTKIDELFSRLNAGVAALEQVKAQLHRYRQAVLEAAMSGELTKEWRGIHRDELEPASALLERILEERRAKSEAEQVEKMKAKGKVPNDDRRKQKYKEPWTPNARLLPPLPRLWAWTSFEELAQGTAHALKAGPFGSSLKKEHYVPSGYKIYGQEQVIRGDPHYGDYYIDEDRYRTLRSCAVHPADVLVSLVGTVGKVLVLPDNIEPGIINPRLVKLSLDRRVVRPEYVEAYLRSANAREYFSLSSHGGTMDILNLTILKALPVALPPPEEQDAILEEIDLCWSIADQMDAGVELNLLRSARLRESILKRAFEGKLVRQDPNEEPASLLLEGIKAEKATRRAKTRPKKKLRRKKGPDQQTLFS